MGKRADKAAIPAQYVTISGFDFRKYVELVFMSLDEFVSIFGGKTFAAPKYAICRRVLTLILRFQSCLLICRFIFLKNHLALRPECPVSYPFVNILVALPLATLELLHYSETIFAHLFVKVD